MMKKKIHILLFYLWFAMMKIMARSERNQIEQLWENRFKQFLLSLSSLLSLVRVENRLNWTEQTELTIQIFGRNRFWTRSWFRCWWSGEVVRRQEVISFTLEKIVLYSSQQLKLQLQIKDTFIKQQLQWVERRIW